MLLYGKAAMLLAFDNLAIVAVIIGVVVVVCWLGWAVLNYVFEILAGLGKFIGWVTLPIFRLIGKFFAWFFDPLVQLYRRKPILSKLLAWGYVCGVAALFGFGFVLTALNSTKVDSTKVGHQPKGTNWPRP